MVRRANRLDPSEIGEGRHPDGNLVHPQARHGGAPEHRLDMLVGVVALPGIAIGLIPRLTQHREDGRCRHARRRICSCPGSIGTPLRVNLLVILETGKGREAKELEDVKRQFLLDDVDVAGPPIRACRSENR